MLCLIYFACFLKKRRWFYFIFLKIYQKRDSITTGWFCVLTRKLFHTLKELMSFISGGPNILDLFGRGKGPEKSEMTPPLLALCPCKFHGQWLQGELKTWIYLLTVLHDDILVYSEGMWLLWRVMLILFNQYQNIRSNGINGSIFSHIANNEILKYTILYNFN